MSLKDSQHLSDKRLALLKVVGTEWEQDGNRTGTRYYDDSIKIHLKLDIDIVIFILNKGISWELILLDQQLEMKF
ncbi:MAG: hypothetical protein RR811_07465 [Comamonas sp.]